MDEEILTTAYMLALLMPALIGIVIGALRTDRSASASTALCSISCVVGLMCYPMCLAVPGFSASFPIGSLLGDYSIEVDDLTGVFVSVSSAVFLMTMIHMSHSGHGYSGRYVSLTCALYMSCVLCMMSSSVILLLLSWEAVSMLTFLMGKSDDEKPRWRFFVITHIGGLILMCAFAYLWSVAGTGDLSQWEDVQHIIGPTASSAVILMIFIGFGTKLGLVPFHAWMPDMYAGSPTHTTVLLTTACSNVAVLILFKTVYAWIGVDSTAQWLPLAMCALAAVSAVWGAMESMVQKEPKRILAYSSMENMALVIMCLSLGMLFHDDMTAIGYLAVLAGLLHTLNHSAFKSLMLLSVDTIEDVTGESSIDRMGGIACVLPWLSAVALIGVMSLAAIPPMNGFVSEWLMLQSLLGTDAMGSGTRVVMPLLIAMMGVCGMIVATSYARLYGFIFLGRPRSESAAQPKHPRKGSMMPLIVLAALCVGMGLFAFPLIDSMATGIDSLIGPGTGTAYGEALSGGLEPLTLGILLAGCVIVMFAATRLFRKERRIGETWGCGGELDEKMQYSPEGFSQPIVRVFHPIYRDVSEKRGDSYTTSFTEPFTRYIYRPVGSFISTVSERVARIQTGNIQSYLSYILATLMVALLAVRLL